MRGEGWDDDERRCVGHPSYVCVCEQWNCMYGRAGRVASGGSGKNIFMIGSCDSMCMSVYVVKKERKISTAYSTIAVSFFLFSIPSCSC